MSVSDDTRIGYEPKGSNAMRLAKSLFWASSTSTVQETQMNEKRRTTSLASVEPTRKGSLVGLPLRLMRSRSKTIEDVQKEVEQPAV